MLPPFYFYTKVREYFVRTPIDVAELLQSCTSVTSTQKALNSKRGCTSLCQCNFAAVLLASAPASVYLENKSVQTS